MAENRFYIEEEGIVFESYTDEPDIETVSTSAVSGLRRRFKISFKKRIISNAAVTQQDSHRAAEEPSCLPGDATAHAEDMSILSEESCIMPGEASKMVMVDIGKLRKAGVPEYVIDMILESKEELSTLKITRSGRIILPEYKIEIKMPPLDKALYFLYLRHPEGIRFKDLCDHRAELIDIYASVSGRSDPGLIRESIDTLVDPMNNSVNEKCSRIKRAFTRAFSPELARNYYIDGKSGEPKSIALDRSFVTWETLRF